MSKPVDVIIVGGGFAGLLIGCEVARRGGRPLVLEAGPSPGGVAASIHDEGYLLEPAAGSFLLPNSDLTPILEFVNATVVPAAEAARHRYVYDRDMLFELAGPRAVASRLVTARGKARLLREPWIRPPREAVDESLASFLKRRFGSEVGLLASTLMAHGVFAGDPDQLSARAAFPGFVELEDSHRSLLRGGIAKRRSRTKGAPRAKVHVAPGGMASLAAELAESLDDDFRADWPVESVRHDGDRWTVKGSGIEGAPAVVVALAPHAAANLVPEPLALVLREAAAAAVAIVGLGGRSVDVPVPSGFGALIGPNSELHVLGLLFESSYAPSRAPARHHLLKAIYGGAADPAALALSDEKLIELAIEEASQILGVAVQPSWTTVHRHEAGIPQYPLGHLDWLGRIDHVSGLFPGLYLAGWGYRGIGVSALAKDAVRLVDVLMDS